MTTEERAKMLEEQRMRKKYFKLLALFLSIGIVASILTNVGSSSTDKSSTNNQNFDWTDAEDVQDFVDWSSERQEENK